MSCRVSGAGLQQRAFHDSAQPPQGGAGRAAAGDFPILEDANRDAGLRFPFAHLTLSASTFASPTELNSYEIAIRAPALTEHCAGEI